MNTTQSSPQRPDRYENNPLFVALKGLDLLFTKALPVGLLLAVLTGFAVAGRASSVFSPEKSTQTTSNQQTGADAVASVPVEAWIVIGLVVALIGIVIALAAFVIKGISDYTSAELAAGREVTLTDAFSAVFHNFWGYLWVNIIVLVKTLLWSLLFVIPGIYMFFRYSLAGVAYFDNEAGVKGNGAIKRSLGLTKGAWLTTFASQILPNLLTFGAVSGIATIGTNAVLYRQFDAVEGKKPGAHALSWLSLLVPIIFAVVISAVVLTLIAAFANYQHSR